MKKEIEEQALQALNDLAEQAQNETMSNKNPNTMWTEMTYKYGFIDGYQKALEGRPSEEEIKDLFRNYSNYNVETYSLRTISTMSEDIFIEVVKSLFPNPIS